MSLLQYIQRRKKSYLPESRKIMSTRITYNNTATYERGISNVAKSPRSTSVRMNKFSLPPIEEYNRINKYDLQPLKTQVVQKLLLSKHESTSLQKIKNDPQNREILSSQRRYRLRSLENNSLNVEQIRMKPVDKYFYHLSNIRLAERLLVIKPSPSLSRDTLKKFYLQQKNYSSQRSKNFQLLKIKNKKKPIKTFKQWII